MSDAQRQALFLFLIQRILACEAFTFNLEQEHLSVQRRVTRFRCFLCRDPPGNPGLNEGPIWG